MDQGYSYGGGDYSWGYAPFHHWLWLPFVGLGILGFVVFILWSVAWKGLALWHSARRHQGWWFVILLVLNTAGILDIIYLFFVLKLHFSDLLKRHE